MRFLNDIKKYEYGNTRFLNIMNHYLVKKDLTAVKWVMLNVGAFTKDSYFIGKYALTNSFFNSPYCNDIFGIAEDIINTMKNMTFSGNVNIKVTKKVDQKLLEPIMYNNEFHETIKEVYKEACLAYNHRAYLLMLTEKVYEVKNENDYVHVGNKFVRFKTIPAFEGHYEDGTFKWIFYKDCDIYNEVNKVYEPISHEFVYEYKTEGSKTILTIRGKRYDSPDYLPDNDVRRILGIEDLVEEYDYTPYFVLDIIDSMLPNIYPIEANLAQALYFQNEDLSNSQTHIYTPENMLYKLSDERITDDYHNKYKTKHIVKGGNLDVQKIEVVEGKSSIDFIEKNIAMNVMRACIDAKISSASLQFSTVDRIGNNTEVGETRERASIRLRENHINILKNYIAIVISTYLKVLGKSVPHEEVTVIFDPYITPSVETTTNVLAKQVQFGLKSREQAVRDLNKNEMSDEDIEVEIEKIKEFTTQQDFNSEQQIKAGSDNAKQEKEKDTTNLKVDNNLKSSGIEE